MVSSFSLLPHYNLLIAETVVFCSIDGRVLFFLSPVPSSSRSHALATCVSLCLLSQTLPFHFIYFLFNSFTISYWWYQFNKPTIQFSFWSAARRERQLGRRPACSARDDDRKRNNCLRQARFVCFLLFLFLTELYFSSVRETFARN